MIEAPDSSCCRLVVSTNRMLSIAVIPDHEQESEHDPELAEADEQLGDAATVRLLCLGPGRPERRLDGSAHGQPSVAPWYCCSGAGKDGTSASEPPSSLRLTQPPLSRLSRRA